MSPDVEAMARIWHPFWYKAVKKGEIKPVPHGSVRMLKTPDDPEPDMQQPGPSTSNALRTMNALPAMRAVVMRVMTSQAAP